MEQELELELKNVVTPEEFYKLISYFSLNNEKFIKQVNHYFDTEDFALKTLGSALRIREKCNTYTLTLKQPYKNGLLESHEKISMELAEKIIQQTEFITGGIANILSDNGVQPAKILYLGSLTTNRAEICFENGTLVFDHSMYFNIEDYELEYEVNQLDEGNRSFQNLLNRLKIPRRETKNKIVRFFEAKQKT